jgi:hypothetical protein
MKTLELPSKAILKVDVAGIRACLELQDAFLEAIKEVKLDLSSSLELRKDLLCSLLPNKRLRAAIEVCMKKSLYNGLHIDVEKTFEPVEARDDLYTTYTTVAEENLRPFVKSLSAEFKVLLDLIQGDHALRQKKTQEAKPTSTSSDSQQPDTVAS